MKRLDVVGIAGSYKQGGEEKKRYVKVGSAWVFEDGNISMSLEAMPVPTPDKDGQHKYHLRTFEPKERGGGNSGGGGW
jgi:hypothetical protein